MREMTPEALKHAYVRSLSLLSLNAARLQPADARRPRPCPQFMLAGGRNRPASVADSTHTDTATERSASPTPFEHESDGDVSPRHLPVHHAPHAADYFRSHHPGDGSERRPPTPYPPRRPDSGSISPISSISSGDGGVPLDERSPPPSPPPHRAPTPHDPLSTLLAHPPGHGPPRAEPPTSRWFRGASGEGPSDYRERQERDAGERRKSAPRNVPTHAALRRKSGSGHYLADDEVPERSSSLPQRKPGQLQINFT